MIDVKIDTKENVSDVLDVQHSIAKDKSSHVNDKSSASGDSKPKKNGLKLFVSATDKKK